MEMHFTPDQQRVIDTHHENVLVSAAAGSGKTAVLVERIIQMISRKEHPVDIDRLLIVTFTNAAAAEMRERISLAISQKLEIEPDNVHLQKQSTLIHNAQITTIDSFCLFLIRNHFNELEIDPSFKIADSNEITLMQKECMEKVLEQYFDQKDPAFVQLVESLASGNGEAQIEEIVLRLYTFASSNPFPKKWILERKKDYDVKTKEELLQEPFMQKLVMDTVQKMEDLCVEYEWAIKICEEPDGPYQYAERLEEELAQLEKCKVADSYEMLETALEAVKFLSLPAKKDDSVNSLKKDRVKRIRDRVKEEIKELREIYFAKQTSAILSDMNMMQPVVSKLVDLTVDFMDSFAQMKKEKNVIDFHDMEHYALSILLKEKEDGTYEPSMVAREYQGYFEEIMIDEYQDSNLVQEYLLESIARKEPAQRNRFMVGDVKQSIYRFRLSKPELFTDKMQAYAEEKIDREGVRIDLCQNFRSRKEVVDACNAVFEKIMCQDLGGVSYDEKARLYLGAEYPESEENYKAELLVLTQKDEEKAEKIDKKEYEARMVAKRILELVGHFKVYDKAKEEYRVARFSDIVLLFRSTTGYEDVFRKVLPEAGIPVYVTSKTGYFSAVEVSSVLSILRVIDNPRQDLYLFAALRTPMFDFSEEEIAMIKSAYQGESQLLYDALVDAKEGIEQQILDKIQYFLEFLTKYRKRAMYVSIHVLIDEILEETAYLSYVSALPNGAQRRANLEMLLEKATEFEKTSYKGLFRFIRYMEQCKEYEIDFGEAKMTTEQEDAVRIMTIHKSKGLEFPICFICGMVKQHNLRDTTQSVLMDMDYGLGIDNFNLDLRTKGINLRKRVMVQRMLEEAVGEELRVLYVAMTRAKEKLIMSAVVDDYGKYMEEKASNFLIRNGHYTKWGLLKSKNYFGWIAMAIVAGVEDISVKIYSKKQIEEENRKDEMAEGVALVGLTQRKPYDGADQELLQKLKKVLQFQYPYASLEKLYTKTTVSELKHAAAEQLEMEQEEGIKLFQDPAGECIPKFMQQEQKMLGTQRGTAYHRVMELLDFTRTYTEESLQEEIAGYVLKKKMSQGEADAVQLSKIMKFLNSSLGVRMKQAAERKKLRKEQPFVYGISANRLKEEFPKEENVLIQGIIDVFWEEEDGYVILDYKTDTLKKEEDFLERYRVQLEYYAEALEKITGKRVKETMMYSFKLAESKSNGVIEVKRR